MRKYGKRIAALALSMVVALGSVCYKPPKAEAVVTETAVGTAVTAAYLESIGLSVGVAGDVASALSAGVGSAAASYATATGAASSGSAFLGSVAAGATMSSAGVIILTAAGAALLAGFAAWMINEFRLLGEDGTPVTDSVGVVPGTLEGYFLYNGVELLDINTVWTNSTKYPYACLLFMNKSSSVPMLVLTDVIPYVADGNLYFDGNFTRYQYKEGIWTDIGSSDSMFYSASVLYTTWSTVDVVNTDDGTVFIPATEYAPAEDWENPILSASLSADYSGEPEVLDAQQMEIDVGAEAGTTLEEWSETVPDQIYNNTFAPTYNIVNVDASSGEGGEGDNTETEPDAGTDDAVGWLEKIWNSIQELPESIASAVADVFVPSAEYMEALPATVTGTFDGRTGFLTYPVSVLYDFSDMLTSGSEDFILEWPDVKEPTSDTVMLAAGEFNVSKFVRDNESLSDVYVIYQYVVGAYLTFLFLGLCRRKYNSVIGDRLGG